MRLYGYRSGGDAGKVMELREISIRASPTTLRRLAEFLTHVAALTERHGSDFGHEHFRDFARDLGSGPDVVVVGEPEIPARRRRSTPGGGP